MMILSKSEYETLNSFQELEEKLILFNGGKNYGQIVFMAGGAGSGKGFAIQNFMQGEKFKVRDVDEWKKALIKLAKMKDSDSELAKLNLRNPEDVFKLHTIVREKGIKDDAKSAAAAAEREKNNTTINKFIKNVESRIYANLSKQLVDNMFGTSCTSDCATSGTAEVEGSTIYWVKDTSTEIITLTITDTDGTTTTMTVPLGDFKY